MRLRMVRPQQRGKPQHLGRILKLTILQIEEAEIEKQLPVIEPQAYRLLVLGQLALMLSHQAIRKPEMIMCQRIVWIAVDHFAMVLNRLGVVFHPQVVVRDRVTDLIIGRGALTAGRRETKRLEEQHYQDAEARAVKD